MKPTTKNFLIIAAIDLALLLAAIVCRHISQDQTAFWSLVLGGLGIVGVQFGTGLLWVVFGQERRWAGPLLGASTLFGAIALWLIFHFL